MNLLPRYTNCQPVILHKRYIDLNGQVAGIGYMIAYLLILVIRVSLPVISLERAVNFILLLAWAGILYQGPNCGYQGLYS